MNPQGVCKVDVCDWTSIKGKKEEPELKVCAGAEKAGMKGHQVACHYADKLIMNGKAGNV